MKNKTLFIAKNISIVVGSVFLCFFLTYKILRFWDEKSEQKQINQRIESASLSEIQMSKIQDGDIILRRGYGLLSDWVADYFNQSAYDVSHAGILYKKGEEWYVIHSLSADNRNISGVIEESLNSFLHYSQANKLVVVRVKNISSMQQNQLVSYAKEYVKMQTPFDKKGNIHDDSELFCTELIWYILFYKMNYFPLPKEESSQKKLWYSMDGLTDESFFEILLSTFENVNKF
ncbi:hypothetical protein AB4865_04955 [Capnocytophaga sp. ARDL2]|uniref:hypothetical protein n=1 Tax=Capnocytophaga sp. ARDL2 TaxID=3238809 RepID=UPI003557456A